MQSTTEEMAREQLKKWQEMTIIKSMVAKPLVMPQGMTNMHCHMLMKCCMLIDEMQLCLLAKCRLCSSIDEFCKLHHLQRMHSSGKAVTFLESHMRPFTLLQQLTGWSDIE